MTIFLAHGSARYADEFVVILLGTALITYVVAVWIGNRLNKESRLQPPIAESNDDKIIVD